MGLWQDVHFALRTMVRSPRVSVTVLLTLALGIGANTAIFSVVNAALLRPLPYRDPGQLVQLRADLPGVGAHNVGFSVPEFDDLRDRAGIFESASVSWEAPVNLTGGDHPERIDFLAVNENYFSLLGARPQLGRLFDDRDKSNGFSGTIVISDSFWHREFGGKANVIGRSIRLDNDEYTIVGVVPAEFRPPLAATARPVDVWTACGFRADPFPPIARSTRFLPAIVGRLKPGMTVGQAQAQLAVFTSSLRQNYPVDYPPASSWTIALTPLKDIVVGNSRTLLVSLLLAVGLILLIACVNVANILLAEAASRQREISIRMAMGARRARIVRQLLTESAILSLGAAFVGTLTAAITLRFLVSALPSQLPHVAAITVDSRVLAFSLAVAFFTTLIFGLAPALRVSKKDRQSAQLWSRSTSAAPGERRLGSVLIGAEVALSLMLLVAAGLLLRTFWDLLHVDPGFQPDHLIAANVWLPVPNDPKMDFYIKPEHRVQLIQESLRRIRTLPGVESAAITNAIPLQDTVIPSGFRIEGDTDRGDAPTATRIFITPDFFKTLGATLISGRTFAETDTAQTPQVALVDEAAAHRFWGDRNPVGMRLRGARDIFFNGKLQPAPWTIVVGIVSNVKMGTLDEQKVPHVYLSLYQTPGRLFGVLVRATGDQAELGREIQREIQAVDPNLPVSNIRSMNEVMSLGVGDRRFAAWLLAIFAAVALVLTCVGIYGVTSYAIAQRTKELGIRSALGASPGNLVGMVLRGGMVPVVAGIASGALGAVLSARLIASLLFSVRATDALIYAAAAVMLAAVGAAASYLPARRAARVDPIVALRVD